MTGAEIPRLDFDGGPWIGRLPLSWTSPWSEVVLAGLTGWFLGHFIPEPVFVEVLGWVMWLILTPVGAMVALLAWLPTGSWFWVPAADWLGPLGWAAVGALGGDVAQAVAPLSFPLRVLVSTASSVFLLLLVGGMSLWLGSG